MPKLNLQRRDTNAVHHSLDDNELDITLRPNFNKPKNTLPASSKLTPNTVNNRWDCLNQPDARAALLDPTTEQTMDAYSKNI